MFYRFLEIAFPQIHPAVAGILYILLSVLPSGGLVIILISTEKAYRQYSVFSNTKSHDQKNSNSQPDRQPGMSPLYPAKIKKRKRHRAT